MTPEISWNDPQALLDLVVTSRGAVPHLVLERLLEHFSFVELGDLPAGDGGATQWAPREWEARTDLRPCSVRVPHFDPARTYTVDAVLKAVERACSVYKSCGIRYPDVTFPASNS